MMRVLRAEFRKLKRARMLLWTLLVPFVIAAVSPALLSAISRPETQEKMAQAGPEFAKAVAAGLYQPTWYNYLHFLPQAIAGSWGILTFGLAAAYVFGREFKEGTMKTILTLPVQRRYTVLAKMVVLAAWVGGLAILAVVFQVCAVAFVQPAGFAWAHVWSCLADSLVVSLLLYLTLPFIALMAMLGKGYLPPMLFSFAAMLVGDAVATTRLSRWIPWNMPVHVVGASWLPVPPSPLVPGSWAVAVTLFVAGVAALVWQIDHADNVQ